MDVAGHDIRRRKVVTGHSCVLSRHSGFTMVELIVVMILIGVLSAVGISRFFDRKVFGAEASVEQSRSMLRYAQKAAIAQHRAVHVRLDGTSMRLCFAAGDPCPADDQVLIPAGGAASVPSLYSGALNHFCFDALGRPVDASDNNAALPSMTFTVPGDASAPSINVAAETGYVS